MFKPLVVSSPAGIYHTKTEMEIGTAVKWEKVAGVATGEIVPAADGLDVIGFTAQKTMTWANRPREYDLFPELFLGFTFDPSFLDLPGFAAGGKVGVWYEKGGQFETEVYAADGVTLMAGLLPDTKLVAAPNGKLTPDVADGRAILASIKGPGTGVGIRLDEATTAYTIVLTGALAN